MDPEPEGEQRAVRPKQVQHKTQHHAQAIDRQHSAAMRQAQVEQPMVDGTQAERVGHVVRTVGRPPAHVRGIQAKLRQIEADDPASKPFTAHLHELVANFDLKRYMNVLETMRHDDAL